VDLRLAGRTAVVTGGTSGIGLATVRRFLDEGANVGFCARGAERVDAVAAELTAAYGPRVVGAAADMTDAAALAAFRDTVQARFGGTDALVHSAGGSRMLTFDQTDDDAWRNELEVKYFGFMRPTQAFLPLLKASDAASVVYVSALLAKQPETRLIATSAARAGVLNLVKSLSIELAPQGVRLNSLLLGVIESGQWERRRRESMARGESASKEEYYARLAREREIPLGRVGTPDEVAAAIVFLSSPLSVYTTGAVLEISGGVSRFV
jgi:NAD(P)-dependent dehydrogenase (short-subunit alcohol dehydrogenase family)